jgi:hypothetical protein
MMSPIFLTAYPDEEIVRRFGVDVKMVAANAPAGFEFHPTPEGKILDEWGVVYQWNEDAQTHFVVEREAPLHRVTAQERSRNIPGPIPRIPAGTGALRKSPSVIRKRGMESQ